MNTAELMRMSDELRDAARLAEEAQRPVRPHDRCRQLALLACLEKRLQSLERQALEAVLVEELWRYLEYVKGTEEEYVVRQVIADIGART